MILQQAIHDYQEAGGRIEIAILRGNPTEKTAVILHFVGQDVHGNLVLHGNSDQIAMQKR